MGKVLSFSSLRLSLQKWLFGELVERPIAEQVPQLGEWFRSPCGQLLLEAEQALLNESLPEFFGYHAMQISMDEGADLLQASPIHHRLSLLSRVAPSELTPVELTPGVHGGRIGNRLLLSTHFDSLPFENDSIDVIILHHVLEFSPNPHQILKEVSRVLIPRGHIIIVGFNPFSLLGLWKGIASLLTRQPQWRYSTITKWRLQDWFKFLDLNKTRVTDTFYRPPCKSALMLNRLAFLERLGTRWRLPLGGAYVMVARKEVVAVTPIRAPWEKLSRRLPNLATARPSTPRIYRQEKRAHEKNFLH